MTVLIEASELYRNHTGIARFGSGWTPHLPPDIDARYSPADYARRRHMTGVRTAAQRARHFGQHVALTQLDLLRSARRERPAVIHSHHFFVPLGAAAPCVATVFDLAFFEYPAETDRVWGAYARLMMGVFVRKAAAVITTTEAVRQQIARRFGIALDRIHRIDGGVDPAFRPVTDAARLDAVRRAYQLDQPFALYVGAWGGTKNLPTLLEAFAPVRGAELILTGAPHNPDEARLPERARALGVRARFIGHVPDALLPALYSLARVVVQPSLYEGYGLPVLEAMACGTPIIISDIPALREVAGDAAPHFPVMDAARLREHLSRLLDDPAERAAWSERGRAHAARYRWETTAGQIAEVWSGLAGSEPGVRSSRVSSH